MSSNKQRCVSGGRPVASDRPSAAPIHIGFVILMSNVVGSIVATQRLASRVSLPSFHELGPREFFFWSLAACALLLLCPALKSWNFRSCDHAFAKSPGRQALHVGWRHHAQMRSLALPPANIPIRAVYRGGKLKHVRRMHA